MVWVLLIICVLFAIIPIHNKKIEFFVFALILGIMIGIFAGCNESTDQFAYKVLYSDNAYFAVEKGYLLLTQMFSAIGCDYTLFKVIIMLISSLLLFWRFKDCNNKVNYRLVLLLWLATSYWFDIEQSRYMIAMVLVIFATRYLERLRRFDEIKYVIIILLAFSIHTSTIVFLLLLFTRINQRNLNLAAVFACGLTAVIGLFGGSIPQLGRLVYSIIPNKRVLMWFSFSTNFGWIGPVLMQFMTYVMVWYSNRIIQRDISIATKHDKQTATLVLKISTILFWVMPLYFLSTEFIRLIRGFFIVYFFIAALAIRFSTYKQKPIYLLYMIVFVLAFNLQGLRGIFFYNDYFVENMIIKNDLNGDLKILFYTLMAPIVFFLLANTNKKLRGGAVGKKLEEERNL